MPVHEVGPDDRLVISLPHMSEDPTPVLGDGGIVFLADEFDVFIVRNARNNTGGRNA